MKHITCIYQALKEKAIDQDTADGLLADIEAYAEQMRRGGTDVAQSKALAAKMAFKQRA